MPSVLFGLNHDFNARHGVADHSFRFAFEDDTSEFRAAVKAGPKDFLVVAPDNDLFHFVAVFETTVTQSNPIFIAIDLQHVRDDQSACGLFIVWGVESWFRCNHRKGAEAV